ncbi:MAG: hypothetical protein R3266_09880, partial [Gemmatimonadota bacterium]|nr:hypothetical protein [Gemmatimonadota bacterium]
QIRTLDLRSAFAGLNAELASTEPFQQPYPLLVSEIDLSPVTNARVDFDLATAAGRYFLLSSSGAHPAMRLALTTPTGAVVPSSTPVRLVLLRTR